jgi:ComF family protein
MSYLSYIKEYMFPSGCGGCGEALFNPEDAWFGLCADCRAYLSAAFHAGEHCGVCGRPLISEKEICLPCRQSKDRLVKLKAIFPYAGRFREILEVYKFEKSVNVGNFLVQCLNLAIIDITDREIAWVPVPPRPGKIKAFGWDQIEFLAKLLERDYKRSLCNIPVNRCLKRLKSRSQKGLNREERFRNLSGRILCVKPPPRTVILFDDVITTGATLNACARALLESGAVKVYGVCLFYD